MKYALLVCNEPAQLVAWVNEAMAEGWKPQGGIAVSQSDAVMQSEGYTLDRFNRVFCQAMTGGEELSIPAGAALN